jgi:preprotein translocase subunit YajC
MSGQDEDGLVLGSVSDPYPKVSPRRRRGVLVTTAAAAALGLAIGGGAMASGSLAGATTSSTATASGSVSHPDMPPNGGTPPAAVGTVKSVGNGTFTITTQDGTTVTVNVSSTTTYLDQGVTSPTIANLTVGEHVAVFGTDTSDTVTATKVAIGNLWHDGHDGHDGHGGPGGPGGFGGTPPAAVGTVKSVGNGTFTITNQDGTTVTVNVSSTTTYLDQGVTSPTIANVTVGEHVAVFGTDTSDTVTATKVAIGNPPNRPDGDNDGAPQFKTGGNWSTSSS